MRDVYAGRFGALGRGNAVEHGLNKGTPCGFSALVGGVDHIQAAVQAQTLIFQLSERGGQLIYLHGRLPPPCCQEQPNTNGPPARF